MAREPGEAIIPKAHGSDPLWPAFCDTRDELKFFARVMGDVRDLDVQIEQLQEWIAQTEEKETLRRFPGS